MKNKKIKLSASDINRYIYCPYQWYYGKCYGQKALKEKYQALDHQRSGHEAHLKKGLHFHQKYYRAYRIKRIMQWAMVFIIIGMILGGLIKWGQW